MQSGLLDLFTLVGSDFSWDSQAIKAAVQMPCTSLSSYKVLAEAGDYPHGSVPTLGAGADPGPHIRQMAILNPGRRRVSPEKKKSANGVSP